MTVKMARKFVEIEEELLGVGAGPDRRREEGWEDKQSFGQEEAYENGGGKEWQIERNGEWKGREAGEGRTEQEVEDKFFTVRFAMPEVHTRAIRMFIGKKGRKAGGREELITW